MNKFIEEMTDDLTTYMHGLVLGHCSQVIREARGLLKEAMLDYEDEYTPGLSVAIDILNKMLEPHTQENNEHGKTNKNKNE